MVTYELGKVDLTFLWKGEPAPGNLDLECRLFVSSKLRSDLLGNPLNLVSSKSFQRCNPRGDEDERNMIFQSIQLDDGTIVNVAALLFFETYEFNLKPRKPTLARNLSTAAMIELSVKKMFAQYPVVMLIDESLLAGADTAIPDVSIAMLLRSDLSHQALSSLIAVCVQNDATGIVDEPNMKRIKGISWSLLATEYRI